MQEFMADFETTTIAEDCRVWQWAICTIPDYVMFARGTSIDTFFESLDANDSTVYFHNLAFDGKFILDDILNRGYEFTKERSLAPGEFSTVISDSGKFYKIAMRMRNGTRIEFHDSLKKLNMSVGAIAQTFQHEAPKGSIDYEKPREVGYVPTEEEWDYIEKDVQIVANALGQVKSQGMTKLTVASSALAEYKELIGKKQFRARFPVLDLDTDDIIRAAYKGGYTYPDTRFRAVKQGAGVVLDVNSLYPYVMYEMPLPYDYPVEFHGEPEPTEESPLWVASVTMTAVLRENHIPILQIKHGSMYNPVDYLTEVSEPTTISLTSVDWELYNEHYEIKVFQWHGGFLFKQRCGMFNQYIDKWMEVKANSTGGLRAIAKLYLNSLYGKFGTNPRVGSKYPKLENGIVKLKMLAEEQKEPVYTAIAVFVTAYARRHTIHAAQANYATFAYCDTDSLHLLRDTIPDSLDVHPSKLGAWKHEYDFVEALFLGSKKYLETEADGTRHNHVAGVPLDAMAQIAIDDVHNGMEIHGKLHPKTVPGGVVLENVVYTLTY